MWFAWIHLAGNAPLDLTGEIARVWGDAFKLVKEMEDIPDGCAW